MTARTGRPRTGITPNFTVRLAPAIVDKAREAAKTSGKRLGRWLEEAIQEKLEREKEEER